ncbi:Mu transposase domain-containing protein [Effusibacillus consociatus]|uniref:Transposase for insertion sequence element IS21-like C-terminal domain-containing protein n=1 Tax=Effusibacillus consociatus TaxID=1117041 RepID=A0ABV9PYU6_9BACL
MANVRVHGTTQVRPVDRWPKEGLKPMNPTPFEVVDRHTLKVSTDCLVSFEANRYSVPFRFVGQMVHVQDDKNGRIRIFSGQELIAEHAKAVGKGKLVIDKKHFEGLRTHGHHRAPTPMPKLLPTPVPEVVQRDLSIYDQFSDEAVIK